MLHLVAQLTGTLRALVHGGPVAEPAPRPLPCFSIVITRADGSISCYARTGGAASDHVIEAIDSRPEPVRISVRCIPSSTRA